MILIGMFDSPFVRRVAVTLNLQASDGAWLIGDRMTQADVTASCVFTFLREASAGEGAPGYPNVAALSQRCEALLAFRAAKAEFSAPGARN